jgi:glycogen debranching enzyme
LKTKPNFNWRKLNWPAVAFLSGLTWISTRYFLRLRQQPPFKKRVAPPGLEEYDTLVTQGMHIAVENLCACIESRQRPDGQVKRMLCAGYRNFREPWARDLSFASYGLLELGDYETVRQSLEVFLYFQQPSGQFPIKVFSTGVFDRYLHSFFKREQPNTAPLKPKFISGHKTLSLDGNLLLVIACLYYITKTGQVDFCQPNWGKLRQAIRWVEGAALGSDGLLFQEAYSDWADSLARTGEVLYTNIVYWKALKEMARYSEKFGEPGEAREWADHMERTRLAIQTRFWRPDLGYYVTGEKMENLSSSGNLLAIAWELADAGQAGSILEAMARFKMDEPVPTQAMHGEYPLKSIAIENRLAGIPEYHTQGAWLWLGAWHVIAAVCLNRLEEAQSILDHISRVVVRDQAVYEVYGTDGHYLSTHWYTAEAPLSWSAGMMIYACHVLIQRLLTERSALEMETA